MANRTTPSRRNTRQGLFCGYWLSMDGSRQRRIYRSEYAELYRLNSKHADIARASSPIRLGRQLQAAQLGIVPLGRIPELEQ